ncbi:MAG TPA: DsbA family protein [Stellaceae bacterium]|nr:DsbA family protein [Stellaceae bacterium]
MRKILLAAAALVWALPILSASAAAGSVPSIAPDDQILGQPNAPVTIFEYASLTCPHCAEFDAETLPKIKANWIDTGKAKLVFRDYPLDQVALRAAILARCAPPERYFAFIDALFQSQANWASARDTREALAHIARLGGIGPDQFDQCMTDQKAADRVVAERLVAQDQYGVDSTPTFFVNGTKVVGAQPYDAFAQSLAAAAGEPAPSASATPPAPAAAMPATPQIPAAPAPAPAPSTAAGSGGLWDTIVAKVKSWFGSH